MDQQQTETGNDKQVVKVPCHLDGLLGALGLMPQGRVDARGRESALVSLLDMTRALDNRQVQALAWLAATWAVAVGD